MTAGTGSTETGRAETAQDGVIGQVEPSYPATHYATPPGATRLILVRHAIPVPYRPGALRSTLHGQDDPPLSAVGRDQASAVVGHLMERKVDAVYSSPLRRALETAEPLVRALGLELAVLPDLREVHLGDWEGGVVHQRLQDNDPLWDLVWREERWDAIPGAEDNHSLRSRVRLALNRIHTQHQDQTVAVFTHDGVIAAALSLATGSRPFAFASASHASTSELVVDGTAQWRVRSFNENAYLHPREHSPR
ncbi:MAG: histidine phosphatase family protein [Candidatus Dormibacteria bacterium]